MTTAEEKVERQGAQVDLPPGSIQILEGSTFMLSDPVGDVIEGSVAGLYHEDTRHLNRFVLTIGGTTPTVLTSREIDYYSATFFTTNPDLDGIPAKSLTLRRHRFAGDGLRETIRVRNHLREPFEVELRLSCGADFADLFEVKGKDFRKPGRSAATTIPTGGRSGSPTSTNRSGRPRRSTPRSPAGSRATTSCGISGSMLSGSDTRAWRSWSTSTTRSRSRPTRCSASRSARPPGS
jgi:glycogen debranching enzyme